MIPKFRAWDKNLKVMLDVQIIDWIGETVGLDAIGGVLETSMEDVELMQSTGLKDKKGVEIFEGDIVKFQDELYQNEFKSYRFKAKDFWLNYQDVPDDFFSEYAYKQCEVVGNVHENPELLEVIE